MSTHKVNRGVDVTYLDGSTEHVDCVDWWLGDGVLHTNVRHVPPLAMGYTIVRGPSFPLTSIRKWEETR